MSLRVLGIMAGVTEQTHDPTLYHRYTVDPSSDNTV